MDGNLTQFDPSPYEKHPKKRGRLPFVLNQGTKRKTLKVAGKLHPLETLTEITPQP